MSTSRRFFLATTAGAAAALAFPADEQKVEIQTGSQIGTVRPELHSHFAEHLGSCVYGGLWVGKNSSVPNIEGYRKQAVEDLKRLGIPVLRWPGGCFADDYHWRDGIGPAAKRPKRVNIHWGNYTEDNSFGTHEFIGLCRLIGAEPYLAGNVGSGTPEELRDWIEYCNYPSGSTLSDERAANGSPEPFRVRYWGVGNENWGCGGSMTGGEYATHYRRFMTYIRTFGGTAPFLIACGPNRGDAAWTTQFMDGMIRRYRIHGFAMHFYSNGKAFATQFTPALMQEQFALMAQMEKAIVDQRALLDKYDPNKRIGLMVDEWGIWDRMVPEEEKKYGRLFQQITQRCAVGAALGLNIFHRQADKLVMCNIAQTVNVLHALLLTDADKCVRTTTYYAFELAAPHRGKTALKTDMADASPLGLSVSASRSGPELVVTLVNPRHDGAMNATVGIAGANATAARARILHDPDMNAANTFATPGRIVPRDHPVKVERGALRIELPPLAVATVTAQVN